MTKTTKWIQHVMGTQAPQDWAPCLLHVSPTPRTDLAPGRHLPSLGSKNILGTISSFFFSFNKSLQGL